MYVRIVTSKQKHGTYKSVQIVDSYRDPKKSKHPITKIVAHLGQVDKGLKQRLRQPQVLQGVLKWAVDGAVRWYESGDQGLEAPDCISDVTKQVRAANDSVGQWIEERVRRSPGLFCPNDVMYPSYKDFCDRYGIKWPKTVTGLARSLKSKGYRAGEVQTKGGQSIRGCCDIAVT